MTDQPPPVRKKVSNRNEVRRSLRHEGNCWGCGSILGKGVGRVMKRKQVEYWQGRLLTHGRYCEKECVR